MPEDQADITPQSIRNSKLPALVRENYRSAIIIDRDTFRNLSPDEKTIYKDALIKALMKMVDDDPGMSPKEKKKAHEHLSSSQNASAIDEMMDAFASPEKEGNKFIHFSVYNGLVNYEGYTNSLFNHVDHMKLPADAKSGNESFVLYHERAHGLYRLEEPGADYMAAIDTLLQHPNSRGTLQIIADYRTVGGISTLKKDPQRDSHSAATEALSGQALNTALAISPQRLEELRRMTPEQRHLAVLNEAQKFDSDLKKYEDEKPGKKIIDAFSSRLNKLEKEGIKFTDPKKKDYEVLKDLLDNNCPFKKGNA